jgi:hypothetical protein
VRDRRENRRDFTNHTGRGDAAKAGSPGRQLAGGARGGSRRAN